MSKRLRKRLALRARIVRAARYRLRKRLEKDTESQLQDDPTEKEKAE